MHLHGGTIKAANAPGGGLIVEMMLPVENVMDERAARRAPVAQSSA
jgi:K+-sensing histidine kinase KdpD